MYEYDECFADDESDVVARHPRSFNHRVIDEKQLPSEDDHRTRTLRISEENECVFDTEWALKRRYSLSSLIYSRFLVRMGGRMKIVRG